MTVSPPTITTTAAKVFRHIVTTRKSAKRFQPNVHIPSETLKDILESAITSPSGFNLQPTQVILLRNQDIKNKLSQNAMLGMGNIYRTKDASAIAVFLSDLQPHLRLPRIIELEQNAKTRTSAYMASLPISTTFLLGEGYVSTNLFKKVTTDLMSPVQPMPTIDDIQSWAYKNTALMVQTFVLAATSHGISTCIMEGYDDRRVKQILNVPDRYGIPMMVAIGYPYKESGNNTDNSINLEEEENKSPRLELNEVVFQDTFGEELSDLLYGDKIRDD